MAYTSSLTDYQWNVIEPLFNEFGYSDINRKHKIRRILDAILYLVNNGIKWREMPNDFPPWQSVYSQFNKWRKDNLWEALNLNLVESARMLEGREASPSLASIDSQSQPAEPGVSNRGIDGNKKINGRKRHIAVDVLGLLLGCVATPANEHDLYAGEILVGQLNDLECFERMKKILGDNAYTGVGCTKLIPVTIESKERGPGQKGFVPEAFRWAVERSFSWLNRQRRLARVYEKRTENQEAMIFIGGIRLALKRIEKRMIASRNT